MDVPAVTLAVSLQGAALDEGLPTALADVWPLAAVDLFVAPQRAGSGEAFATDAAAVRFYSSVAPHVSLHVLEHLPTDVTRPAGVSVRLQVSH